MPQIQTHLNPKSTRNRGKSRLDLSNLEAELREPYLIFENLSVEQLQDLQHDIREYQVIDQRG